MDSFISTVLTEVGEQMHEKKKKREIGYIQPNPLMNKREIAALDSLTEEYNKLITPNKLVKVGEKIGEMIPKEVKEFGGGIKGRISKAELFNQCMKVVADGFGVIEKNAAKVTISESKLIKKVALLDKKNNITSLEEFCLVRGYSISGLVQKYKTSDRLLAFVEGGVTGYFGFPGIPFNLVLSTFIYYRAVQQVAMFYGYDVKNNASELMISSEVFMNALSPGKQGSTNEMGNIIAKIMVMSEVSAVKQAAKKTWSEMAARGGIELLIVQMRALANKSAQKALEKAGQKGLEESVFKTLFEQIGKKMSKKALTKAVPFVGAAIGGFFDIAQMNKVLNYADIFYNKRFLLEKEARINSLISGESDETINEIIDIDTYM